jgi:hypothetical protein
MKVARLVTALAAGIGILASGVALKTSTPTDQADTLWS